MARLLRNIEAGRGSSDDLDTILSICRNMIGKTVCVFADGAAAPVSSIITKFRREFISHLQGRCSSCLASALPV
jgi:NADH-quinone oxidoreductase subunit F